MIFYKYLIKKLVKWNEPTYLGTHHFQLFFALDSTQLRAMAFDYCFKFRLNYFTWYLKLHKRFAFLQVLFSFYLFLFFLFLINFITCWYSVKIVCSCYFFCYCRMFVLFNQIFSYFINVQNNINKKILLDTEILKIYI